MTQQSELNSLPSRSHFGRWIAAILVLLAGGALVYCYFLPSSSESVVSGPPLAEPKEASEAQVRPFCGKACHAFPPADTFPRSAWRREVKQAYDFFNKSELVADFPSLESVALYYERRAPEALPLLKQAKPPQPLPVSFRRKEFRLPTEPSHPAVSNVNLVHLFDKRRLDVLACEMRLGQILALEPYASVPAWKVLYSHGPDRGFNPAHAEVVDLDGDGIQDVLVANLGYFGPTDATCGSVLWLRGLGEGRFEPHTLLDGVGRVADVQAADFRGVGKLDLVVAVFGWRNTGGIVYLENQTTDWKKPRFVARVLDERNGPIHVPVADLNGDGKPDFVALISQEHETIVAFLNEGGRFRKETIFAAPHPAYGSSSIQLVDLNNDSKLDVLYANGDSLDPPYVLRPYHGVQWLENQGRFPFQHHPLTSMYGVARAIAADFTGKGHKDILAVSLLTAEEYPRREELQLDSVVLLEQKAPGEYVRHSLETVACDHFTCAAGDIYNDGTIHFVTGSCTITGGVPIPQAVTIWQNLRSQSRP
jgi:hypothetical protein